MLHRLIGRVLLALGTISLALSPSIASAQDTIARAQAASAQAQAAQAKASIAVINANTQHPELRLMLFGDSINNQAVVYGNGSASAGDAPAGAIIPAGQNEYAYTQVGVITAYQQLYGHPFYLDPLMVKAAGGNTTNQMCARMATDVLPFLSQIDVVDIVAGTNDGPAGISKETTFLNLRDCIFAPILAAGKKIIWHPILPRTGFTSNVASLKTQWLKGYMHVNAAIRLWQRTLATSTPFYSIDAWADLSDPASVAQNFGSGSVTINAAAFQDGLHPNGYGNYLMARRMAPSLSWVPPVDHRSTGVLGYFDATLSPNGNSLANASLFTTTGGTNNGASVTASSVPASWRVTQAAATGSATIVASEVSYTTVAAGAPGLGASLGNVARFVVNMAAGKANPIRVTLDQVNAMPVANWAPGRRVYAKAIVTCSGLAGFAGASLSIAYSYNGTVVTRRGDGVPSHGYAWGQDNQTLTLVTPEMTIPADAVTGLYSLYGVTTYWNPTSAAATGTCDVTDMQTISAN